MKYHLLALGLAVSAFSVTTWSAASEKVTGTDTTAKWMIEQERAWAEEACSNNGVTTELLADDFHGTSTKGKRYDKPKSTNDSNRVLSSDCRLLDADVRFFGHHIAIIYGSETRLDAHPDAKQERKCQVWTDTWLKRSGKWQIVAAQDTLVECPPM